MSDFRVQGRLGLDGAAFFSTLNRARGAVGSFGAAMAGAFSVGAITAFSKSILDLAGNLNDVSEALGLNVEYLQKFLNSARQSGGSLGDIEKFLFESNKSRQAALNDPNGKDAKAFSQLGFSSGQIANASPKEFLNKIIEALADGATPQDLNALAEIGGKSAKKLVGGFKDGLDEATAIMTSEVVAQLDEIGDRFTSLATTLKTIFAPAILKVVEVVQAFADTAVAVVAFYKTLLSTGSMDKAAKARDEILLEQTARERKTTQRLENRKNNIADAAGPGFTSEAKAAKSSPFKSDIYSDSRLAIGGFLGAGKTDRLQSIAESQLQVTREHLAVSKSLLTAVGSRGDTLIIGI